MTFRPPKKPGSRKHLPWTPAQQRAFLIMRLRGLWHNSHPLTGSFLDDYRDAIDGALREMGAQPESERQKMESAE